MTRETQSSFSENLQHAEETHRQYRRIQGWKLSHSESQDIYIAVGKSMIERDPPVENNMEELHGGGTV